MYTQKIFYSFRLEIEHTSGRLDVAEKIVDKHCDDFQDNGNDKYTEMVIQALADLDVIEKYLEEAMGKIYAKYNVSTPDRSGKLS